LILEFRLNNIGENKMKTLEAKLPKEITGEMEVVTVRTPSGKYTHKVFLRPTIIVTQAEIEEAQKINVQLYGDEMKRLSRSKVIVVEDVRTFIEKKNYTEKRRYFTYPTLAFKEQGDTLALMR
jgi:hypothetical protein